MNELVLVLRFLVNNWIIIMVSIIVPVFMTYCTFVVQSMFERQKAKDRIDADILKFKQDLDDRIVRDSAEKVVDYFDRVPYSPPVVRASSYISGVAQLGYLPSFYPSGNVIVGSGDLYIPQIKESVSEIKVNPNVHKCKHCGHTYFIPFDKLEKITSIKCPECGGQYE